MLQDIFLTVIYFHLISLSSLLILFTKQKEAPTWWGYALAFLMFFTAFLQTLILHQHFQYCFVTGMRLRTSIIGAIYRKVHTGRSMHTHRETHTQKHARTHAYTHKNTHTQKHARTYPYACIHANTHTFTTVAKVLNLFLFCLYLSISLLSALSP